MRASLLYLVMLLPLSAQAQAQTDASTEQYPFKEWYTIGLGAGSPYDMYFGASYSFAKKHFYQAAFGSDMQLWGRSYVSAFSFSAGKRAAAKYVIATAFAGPAFVWGRHDVGADRPLSMFYSAGIALNGQLYVRPLVDIGTVAGIPLGGIGFGLDLGGNLNPVQSTIGYRIGFYLGTPH